MLITNIIASLNPPSRAQICELTDTYEVPRVSAPERHPRALSLALSRESDEANPLRSHVDLTRSFARRSAVRENFAGPDLRASVYHAGCIAERNAGQVPVRKRQLRLHQTRRHDPHAGCRETPHGHRCAHGQQGRAEP